jgi:hypothetical protein
MRSILPRNFILCLALAACTQESPKPSDSNPHPAVVPPKESAVRPIDAVLLGSSDSRFVAQVDQASAVFVGKLVDVGPPPAAFSGYRVATQALTYQVERVLRGQLALGPLTVHHVIVAQSPALIDGKPALKPEATQVGTEYIVALGGMMEGKQVTANENVAPQQATSELLTQVEAKLKP